MKKRYRIKNKFRFVFFVTLFVLICSLAIGAVFPVAASSSGRRMTQVKVQSGDTLWDLARTYGDQNKDIREVIYDICSINGISASELYVGTTIYIPQ